MIETGQLATLTFQAFSLGATAKSGVQLAVVLKKLSEQQSSTGDLGSSVECFVIVIQ
jgi:hypothetical protein